MDILSLAALLFVGGWMLKAGEQRRRIGLLASCLQRYQIERNMEMLTQGYLRAAGEPHAQRRAQLFEMLRPTEDALCAQFERFAAEFARADAAATRVSQLPVWLPFALAWAPGASFDMRAALAVHARGICAAIRQQSTPERERAFTISAELFLMQHTCHWFCKSRMVASARMLARHKTSYDQLLAGVLPQTRADYRQVVGR